MVFYLRSYLTNLFITFLRLIISAPRSKLDAPNNLDYDPKYGPPNTGGSVFKCRFNGNPNDCTMLEYKFETTGGLVKVNASHMLLGQTVVAASGGTTSFQSPISSSAIPRHSAACAPLLKSIASQDLPTGSCFLWDANFRAKSLKTKLYNLDSADYRNMLGFSGASYGHKNADIFVFGVPGHGTVYSGGDDYRATDQGGLVIEVVEQRRTKEHRVLGFNPTPYEAYAGFSVALSDIFTNGNPDIVTVITGAPRAGNLTGRVYFINFDVLSLKEDRLEDLTIIGSDEVPMGSQFGYSLLPVDFNNDGFVDLLVSAPFAFDRTPAQFQSQSKPTSTGAVLAYLNLPDQNGRRSLTLNNPVILFPPTCDISKVKACSPSTKDSLFGLSMASPGDIDGDGMLDVAIGAPGENEGKGAVYIYRGSYGGLALSARLQPKTATNYFGFSLSGGNIDVDGNGYPDLAVGSFKSDQAWILRSRPIIRVEASLLNTTGKRFLYTDEDWPTEFKLCLDMSSPVPLFKSEVSSARLYLKIVLELDSSRAEAGRSRRLTFIDKTSTLSREIRLETRARQPWIQSYCIEDIQVVAAPSVLDPLTPVNITMKLDSKVEVQPLSSLLIQDTDDEFSLSPIEPIIHPDNLTQMWLVEFERDCGDDFKCIADLEVKVSFGNAVEEGIIKQEDVNKYDYVRGSSTANSLTLSVQVTNAGEPAYNAKLFIAHTNGLSFRSTPASNIKCEQQPKSKQNEDTETMIACTITPFPPQGWSSNIDLIFDVTRMLSTREHFTIFANSSSTEATPENNKMTVDLNVYTTSTLMLSAASSPEQLNYSATAEIKGEMAMSYFDEAGPYLEHVFIVENAGPAAVRGLSLIVAWPGEQDCPNEQCDRLLYLTDEISVSGGGGGSCEATLDINPVRLVDRPKPDLVVESASMLRVKRYAFDGRLMEQSVKENCQNNNRMSELVGNVRCKVSICHINRLDEGHRTRVTLKFRIWQATLVKNFDASSLLVLASMAHLRHSEATRPRNGSQLDATAYTEVYTVNKLASKGMLSSPWFIALLSVALGLLIVLILILILYCCGFFKRKRNPRPPPQTAKVEQIRNCAYEPVPQENFDSSRL